MLAYITADRPRTWLGAVSVMDVEIEDQDLVHTVRALEITRRNRHVVEQAEAERHALLGMVSGWAAECEAVLDVLPPRCDRPARGPARREPGHVRCSGERSRRRPRRGTARRSGRSAPRGQCNPRRAPSRSMPDPAMVASTARGCRTSRGLRARPSWRRDAPFAPGDRGPHVVEEAGVVEKPCRHRHHLNSEHAAPRGTAGPARHSDAQSARCRPVSSSLRVRTDPGRRIRQRASVPESPCPPERARSRQTRLPSADDRVIEHHRLDTHQGAILHRASVQRRMVSHAHSLSPIMRGTPSSTCRTAAS